MAKAGKRVIKTPAQIAKKYHGTGTPAELFPEDPLWLPSRNVVTNYVTGGGLQYGRMLELFGEESSGKSLLAVEYGYAAQKLGGQILWVDAELAFSKSFYESLGLDMEQIHLMQSNVIEQIGDWVRDMAYACRSQLSNNEPILLVVDSLAALDTLDAMNTEFADKKAEMGIRAKKIYEMIRQLNPVLTDLGICTIFINQLRKKLGATQWEDPDVTPGGGAMKFYAGIRLGVYGGKMIRADIKGDKRRVGREGSLRVKKNKLAPPTDTIKYKIYNNAKYKEKPLGFDRYFGLFDILMYEEVIYKESKTARNIFHEGEVIARSEDNFYEVIESNAKLRRQLIKAASINTISTTSKRIKDMGRNLYPVDDE